VGNGESTQAYDHSDSVLSLSPQLDLGVGEHVDQAAAGGQFAAEFASPSVPGGLQVFEADAGRGELG
jgi:hypothetical protein